MQLHLIMPTRRVIMSYSLRPIQFFFSPNITHAEKSFIKYSLHGIERIGAIMIIITVKQESWTIIVTAQCVMILEESIIVHFLAITLFVSSRCLKVIFYGGYAPIKC